MMNGRGKSDSAIVAGKPTNKAGQPAAESVEPSAGAEGNVSQQSTRRAQDWESVSQALDRIRQVARQRKKERFTSLFHHTSTFWPSTYPVSFSPWWNARRRIEYTSGDALLRNPISGIAGCCARAKRPRGRRAAR